VDLEISDAIARKVLSFALQLKNEMLNNKPKTAIFSPVSIMSALAIILIGSKGARLANLTDLFGQPDLQTMHLQFALMLKDVVQPIKENTSPLRELDPWHNDSTNSSLLKYSMRGNGAQSVRLANGLFLQLGYRLKSAQRQLITEYYRPDILHVDFKERPVESINAINTWINLVSNDQVDEMLKHSLDASSDRVFVTTMSMKAIWEMVFATGLTKYKNFFRNGVYGKGSDKPISVNMMTAAGAFPYYLSFRLGCHIIGIPYEGDMTTMYLIKPYNSSVKVLKEFQKKLTADDIEDMIKNMRRRSAIVVVPKLSFDESLALRFPLERMGLTSIFGPSKNRKAGSKGPQSTQSAKDLTVTQIFQSIHLSIDEKETEISDGNIGVEVRSAADATFLANEPFILLVRNDLTKLPLFYGTVFEPLTAK
ncbi:hypothetical protein KR093_006821, partial [Drosophila rubida]